MIGRFLCVLSTLTALILPATGANAQRGGFSPDGIFDRLDQDGSGVIEPEEIENSRMRRYVERLEIDTSRGITREQFTDLMDQARQRYAEDRESRRRDEEDRGDREVRRDGDDRSSSDREERRTEGRRRDDRNNPRSRPSTPTPAAPPQRVTIDLQAEFSAGDTDRDGQIGLYEWTQWKSRTALAEFLGIDRNGDGFLTPRELTRAAEAQPVDLASVLPIGPEAAIGATTMSPTQLTKDVEAQTSTFESPAAPDTDNVGPTNSATVISSADPGQVQQAERYFSLLDRDRDGSISDLEWRRSRRLKPKFEAAGANLEEPMSSGEFVSYYVRIFATTNTGE